VRASVLGAFVDDELVGGALVRFIPVPFTGTTLAECLHGPIFRRWRASWAPTLVEGLEKLSAEANCLQLSLKACPRADVHADVHEAMMSSGLRASFARGDSLAVVDLEDTSSDELWTSYSYGTRRNIKKARQSGVEVRFLTKPEELRRAHAAWLSTAERKHFDDVRPWETLEPVIQQCLDQSTGFVLGSFKDGQLLAAIFVTQIGGVADYIYGGYFDGADQYRPNHILHHEAILHAKQNGMRAYSLGTLVRPDTPGHGMDRFKLGFSSNVRSNLDTVVWERRPLLHRGLEWLRRNALGAKIQSTLRRRMTRRR
jgi:hypothetical protein